MEEKGEDRQHFRLPQKLARIRTASVAAALSAIGAAPAWGIEFDTGNPDVLLRWDNTVRYNLGWRLEDINPHFANAFGSDETELRFKKHDLIVNRLDLLSELDYSVRNDYGFRVSAAAWSEHAYPDTTRTSDRINSIFTGSQAVPSSYGPSGRYSNYARRYVTGDSGEILDAFVFGNFDLGRTSFRYRLGQHTVYWGEASFTQTDSIAHGMARMDGIKGQTSPGAEAKELFMPVKQFTFQWALSDELSLQGLYQFDWKPTRAAPGGTYFAASDGSGDTSAAGSPVCASTAPGSCTPYLDPVTPGRKGGDFGLAARWSPAWLDGTLGFYYRKYDEKTPWSTIQLQGHTPTAANMGLRLSYARDTELLGISLGKSLGPVSAGFEASYRRNTALSSVSGFFAGSSAGMGPATSAFFASPAADIPLSQMPDYDLVEGARGNTFHLVANGSMLLKRTPLWDTGVLVGELAYQRLDKVTRNGSLFYSEDYACRFGYAPSGLAAGARDRSDGCATRDALALSLTFMPQWVQPFPGLALSMPISISYGLRGNSPSLSGNYEGAYRWSIGLTALYRTRYEFAIALVDQHQDYKTATATARNGVPGEQVFSTGAGTTPIQNNHRWLSVRFKTSF